MELSPFDTRKLDQTKRQAVPIETRYNEIRMQDGVRLRRRYRNNGSASQWGCGSDLTGRNQGGGQKKKGPKTYVYGSVILRLTAGGKMVKEKVAL